MSSLYRTGAFACLLILAACGKQGEGERCDINSGSLDCEVGLICRSADQLSIVGRGLALCCPPDDVQPNVNACRAGAELPTDEGEIPSETPAGDAGALPPPALDGGL